MADKNDKYLTIHGHFYQPPRENPWLEEIEIQESAWPNHNWNERIACECYAPNSVSRVADHHNKVLQILNNYEFMSFNFGPTLLSWMEKNSPEAYDRILQADKNSVSARGGHGNAIAQVYNHIIMPLANERDKVTQVLWGVKDFEHRFKRKPEGIWLAETAVDDETLEVLANNDIKFTVLSPYQAQCIRKIDENCHDGEQGWQDVSWGSVDPSMPYRYFLKDESGKYIDIFFYDGAISKSVAFDNLLRDGQKFISRLNDGYVAERNRPQIVNIGTDGESYGHHTKFGDMALSYVFALKAEDYGFQITNYGEFLEKFQPSYEVVVKNDSSWSCCHGIGRWLEDCGCSTGGQAGWNQKWRMPLRRAFDYLRDELIILCEISAQKYFKDFWAARNAYIDVILDRSEENIDKFFAQYAKKKLSQKDKIKAIKLLEIQRQSMLMYTSCGWFFSEISGIETTQIMKYALRAMQLAKDFSDTDYEKKFLSILQKAKSNIHQFGDGRNIYNMFVKEAQITIEQVVAHWAISSAFESESDSSSIYCYDIKKVSYKKIKKDSSLLVVGRIEISSRITLEKQDAIFALYGMSDGEVYCAVSEFEDSVKFSEVKKSIIEAFNSGDPIKTIHVIENGVSKELFTFKDVLIDKRKGILEKTIHKKLMNFAKTYESLYSDMKSTVMHLSNLGMDIPDVFRLAAKYSLSRKLESMLENIVSFDDKKQLEKIAEIKNEADKFFINLNKTRANEILSKRLEELLAKLITTLSLKSAKELKSLFELINLLEVDFGIANAQNLYFEKIFRKMDVIIEHLKNSNKKTHDRQLALLLLDIGDYLRINTEFYRPYVDRASLPNR